MMNPSATGLWNDPPPPGIEEDGSTSRSPVDETLQCIVVKNDNFVKKNDEKSERIHHRKQRSRSRSYDRYRSKSRERKRRRHRSRSHGRRRRRSRTRSKGSHHRRRYSTSHSRSRSSSYDRNRHKHKKDKRKRSKSRRYSKSRSRSGSYKHTRSKRYSRDRKSYCNPYPPDDFDDKDDEDDQDEPAKELPFKNDGSFLEMFKKMQEEQQKAETSKTDENEPKKPLPVFGKRRGGRVLKTGLVQKNKNNRQDDTNDVQDPWSIYLKEVKRYKEACCDDNSKTRPLLK